MIRVGLDFDGVVVYNPLRILRAPIKLLKRDFLGVRQLKFFIPRNWWQRVLMRFYYAGSVWPAKGVSLLRDLGNRKDIEFYLITGRFGSINSNLREWIEGQGLGHVFKKIYINNNDEQPHIFKQRIILELDLDYFVEDNLDVAEYVKSKSTAKIFWIYNFLDKRHSFPNKFPFLEKALEKIAG